MITLVALELLIVRGPSVWTSLQSSCEVVDLGSFLFLENSHIPTLSERARRHTFAGVGISPSNKRSSSLPELMSTVMEMDDGGRSSSGTFVVPGRRYTQLSR